MWLFKNTIKKSFLNFRNFFILSNLTDNLGHDYTNLWSHYQTIFFKGFFCFTILSSRISRDMCKLHHKWKNPKNCVGPTFTLLNGGWARLGISKFGWRQEIVTGMNILASFSVRNKIVLMFIGLTGVERCPHSSH